MHGGDPIEQILSELRELRALIEAPPARPDDFVDCAYVAARAGLAERTVREGKAGTNALPRVVLDEESRRPLIRFQRAAVDNWLRELARKAAARQPRQRALQLVRRKSRRRSA